MAEQALVQVSANGDRVLLVADGFFELSVTADDAARIARQLDKCSLSAKGAEIRNRINKIVRGEA